jgi:Domain of unknown function (DUF4126)
MSLISTIALAMGASWTSGINLYASVATLGLLGRFTQLQLPGELEVLTSWWIIGIASGLYVIEFLADKVPWLDSTWDLIHTFIRVPAGAVLAAAAFGDFDKTVQVIALLLGGGLALSSHGTKAATRAVINASPEPVTNVIASVVEDIIAVLSILAAVFVPVLLFLIVAIGLFVSYLALPRVVRFLRQVFRSVRRVFAPASS